MVIGHTQKLPVGTRGKGIKTTFDIPFNYEQPWVIIRETNKAEWLLEHPGGTTYGIYFYEISTD